MKLTELSNKLCEVMEICKKEKVDPEIWVKSDFETNQIDKMELNIGYTENNEKVSFLTFHLENHKE